ncbi:MAG: hypothetical protein HZA28_03615 [Candidatus Omnitrophica bacterium]|nr:hypothetical protein [Candidatus Omnitrophota bacterium]
MSRKKQAAALDFEIRFYEGILRRSPGFIEALSALGDLYTRTGLHEQGLRLDERLYQLRPNDPIVLYNLACSYSLVNDRDKAFRAIKQAIHCGYDDFDHLARDSDLHNLLNDRRFARYFERLKSRKPVKAGS